VGHQGGEIALERVEFLFLFQRLGELFGLPLNFRRALLDPLFQPLVGLLQRLFAPEDVDVLLLEDAVGSILAISGVTSE
jgi:hypothetical protein